VRAAGDQPPNLQNQPPERNPEDVIISYYIIKYKIRAQAAVAPKWRKESKTMILKRNPSGLKPPNFRPSQTKKRTK
jgi:hypothetical protein